MLDTIYHNLVHVREMYRSTLNMDFPDISECIKYVKIRHDLVHRNGKTKDGDLLEINRLTIESLIEVVNKLINKIIIEIELDDGGPF